MVYVVNGDLHLSWREQWFVASGWGWIVNLMHLMQADCKAKLCNMYSNALIYLPALTQSALVDSLSLAVHGYTLSWDSRTLCGGLAKGKLPDSLPSISESHISDTDPLDHVKLLPKKHPSDQGIRFLEFCLLRIFTNTLTLHLIFVFHYVLHETCIWMLLYVGRTVVKELLSRHHHWNIVAEKSSFSRLLC